MAAHTVIRLAVTCKVKLVLNGVHTKQLVNANFSNKDQIRLFIDLDAFMNKCTFNSEGTELH